MKKDHYQVLGVSRDSTSQSIRKAFRKHAKECHPDRCGSEREGRFQELNTAHEVLCNPESRQLYDRTLEPARESPEVHFEARPPAWPYSSWSRHVGAPKPWQPGEFIRDASGPVSPAGQPPHPPSRRVLELELELSLDEQLLGVVLPLVVTLPSSCPRCASAHRAEVGRCALCDGFGEVRSMTRVELRVPPGLEPGRVIHASVEPPLTDTPLLLRMTVI